MPPSRDPLPPGDAHPGAPRAPDGGAAGEPESIVLRNLLPADGAAIAVIDARANPHPWSETALRETLAVDAGVGAVDDAGMLCGFVLWRAVAGEAEILEIAVDPAAWRQGLGRRLLRAALAAAAGSGAVRCILEVRVSNAPARALYAAEGFVQCGLRRGYYRTGSGREDALLLHRQLP